LAAIVRQFGMLRFLVTMWWRTRAVRKLWSNGSADIPSHLRPNRISRWADGAVVVIFSATAIGLAACFLIYLFDVIGG
jgi:hypothetical protein